jgi:hypothetical protein
MTHEGEYGFIFETLTEDSETAAPVSNLGD